MGYKITVNDDNKIIDLFHTEISPTDIIPAEAIDITDEQGDMMSEEGHYLFSYINGECIKD